MAQTIDQGRLSDRAQLSRGQAWTDLDLALADARIVAELARRIEISAVAAGRESERAARPGRHDLSAQTVRELLSVVETLTLRESARRASRACPPSAR